MSFIVNEIDQTLDQLLTEYDFQGSNDDFLAVKLDGVTNGDRIKRRYNSQQLADNESKFAGADGSIIIVAGTPLVLPPSLLERDPDRQLPDEEIAITQYKPFLAQRLAELLADPKYARKSLDATSGNTTAVVEYNEATVLIWCRALRKWIDVSPHLTGVQTMVGENGGSFSFTLTDLMATHQQNVGWIADDSAQVVSSPLRYDRWSEVVKNNFYYHTILGVNDLVFIKLERLELDADDIVEPANQVWDMIGLLDTTSMNNTPSSVTTTATGRDLMKVFIEDGSIFFTSQFAGNIFANSESLLAQRNLFSLSEQTLTYQFGTFKTVSSLLKYLFNKFCNLGLVPNEALSSYGDKQLLDKYELQTSKQKAKGNGDVIDLLSTTTPGQRQGVWRIMDLIFDREPVTRLVSDPSFSQDNGSVLNSIRKICQAPFIEFMGDTYGDKYYLTVRKPPIDREGYVGLVYGNVGSEGVDGNNATGKTGSDTKQKNYTRNRIAQQSQSTNRAAELSSYVIDIDPASVLSDQLQYHSEAYSWYRLIPIGLGALDEQSQFLLSPVLAFDEYAEVWGSKTYSLEYNYTPSTLLSDKNSNRMYKYIEAQAFLDLQFVVQSHQYLPFTRQGRIVLSGDRTIKKGTFIYYKPTREVFLVDAVVHMRTIGMQAGENNRQTILTVSRGMREMYIRGREETMDDGSTQFISYFNIIDTPIDNKASIDSKDVLKNWKVNRKVFDFFVQRHQWR